MQDSHGGAGQVDRQLALSLHAEGCDVTLTLFAPWTAPVPDGRRLARRCWIPRPSTGGDLQRRESQTPADFVHASGAHTQKGPAVIGPATSRVGKNRADCSASGRAAPRSRRQRHDN